MKTAPMRVVKTCAVHLQGTTILHSVLLLTYRIHKEGDNRFKYDYNHRVYYSTVKIIGEKTRSVIKIISVLNGVTCLLQVL